MNVGKLKIFAFDGKIQSIKFIETIKVKTGVECDVYKFLNDDSKDLGIIRIEKGSWTPPQKILLGEKTVEGYISGKGKFVIIRGSDKREAYTVDDNKKEFSVNVKVGDTMQWQADKDSELIAYEICIPPYADGRFKNLPDGKI